MRKIGYALVSVLILMAISACNQPVAQTETAPAEKALMIINLKSDVMASPHSGLMGLHLGKKALANDVDVHVFLNVNGVKLATAAADTLTFHGESLQQVLKEIMDGGGAVSACPHCMEANGIEETQLIQGVTLVEDSVLMAAVKQKAVVFSY